MKVLMPGYKKRLIDARVSEYLETFGAVCIEGPKWCGKTWTAQNHANSKIDLGDSSQNFQNRKLAQLSPSSVLKGATPHLIDEAAKNLVKIRNVLLSKKVGSAPTFLAVICGLSNAAYQRKEDGVFVLPITALKP